MNYMSNATFRRAAFALKARLANHTPLRQSEFPLTG
jgi:hypothetical protein